MKSLKFQGNWILMSADRSMLETKAETGLVSLFAKG